MKFNTILETAAKTFSGVKLGGKKSDPKLAALDRGVLTVGLLVAALDGTIQHEEYAAFHALAKKCRGGSTKNVRALIDAVLPAVGRLMAMAQVGVYSDDERLLAFLSAAKKALPRGFADGSLADLRRAFALWVTMGVADGEFSRVEKQAIHALIRRMAIARSMKAKNGVAQTFQLLEADFLTKAEKIARDLAAPKKRTNVETALEELVATVQTVDENGNKTIAPACDVAVNLSVMALFGQAVASATTVWEWSDDSVSSPQ